MSNSGEYLRPLNQGIYEHWKEHFDASRDLLNYSAVILRELNAKKMTPKDMDNFSIFALHSFFKSTTHGINLWLIASGGYHIEAYILLRPVIEIYIQLMYILQHNCSDLERITEQFYDYINLKEIKSLHHALEIAKNMGATEYEDNLKSRINILNEKLEGKTAKDFKPWNNIKDIAKEAGLLSYYKSVYDMHSKYVHTSSHTIYGYYDPIMGSWSMQPKPKHMDDIIISFCDPYIKIIEALSAHFWGHPFKEFDGFVITFNKLKEKAEASLDKRMETD